MQNMHKTTHDGPLTGVHLPIHRCSGADLTLPYRARVRLSTHAEERGGGLRLLSTSLRGLGSVDGSVNRILNIPRRFGNKPENRADF